MKKHSSLLAMVAVCAIGAMALTGGSPAPQDTTSTKSKTKTTHPKTMPHPANPGQSRGMMHNNDFDNASYKGRSEMMRLWAEHEVFARNYIVSASAGLPDAQVAADQLMESSNEIGQSLQSYYGNTATQKLTSLMRDHVMLITELVEVASGNPAVKPSAGASSPAGTTGAPGTSGTTGTGNTGGVTGDRTGNASSDRTTDNSTTDRNMGGTTGSTTTPPTPGSTDVYGNTRNAPGINRNIDQQRLSDVQQRLTANAKNIATFLNTSNPNWKSSDLQGMMQQQVDNVVAQVTARAKGDWQADIQAFEQGLDQSFRFAEALSRGIEQQFPDRFAQAKR